MNNLYPVESVPCRGGVEGETRAALGRREPGQPGERTPLLPYRDLSRTPRIDYRIFVVSQQSKPLMHSID